MSETTRVYKITRPDLTTYKGFQWRVGEWRTFPGTGELCGPGFAHFYLSPQLAVLLNPIHADYAPYKLWLAEGRIEKRDHQLKVGCSRARLLEEIEVPDIPMENRVTFGLHVALTVHAESGFTTWAESWLRGENRASAAAWAAARAASAAAWAAEAATLGSLDIVPIAAVALLPWEPA